MRPACLPDRRRQTRGCWTFEASVVFTVRPRLCREMYQDSWEPSKWALRQWGGVGTEWGELRGKFPFSLFSLFVLTEDGVGRDTVTIVSFRCLTVCHMVEVSQSLLGLWEKSTLLIDSQSIWLQADSCLHPSEMFFCHKEMLTKELKTYFLL